MDHKEEEQEEPWLPASQPMFGSTPQEDKKERKLSCGNCHHSSFTFACRSCKALLFHQKALDLYQRKQQLTRMDYLTKVVELFEREFFN